MNKMSVNTRVILIAFFVSIVARLHINFFIDGFIITFAAIVLAVALYFDEEIHPIYLGFAVAIVSPSVRWLIDYIFTDTTDLFLKVYPDAFYYITYGIVFYLMKVYLGDKYKSHFYMVAVVSDVMSNVVELLVRTKISGLDIKMIQGIILVGVARTTIIMFFIYLAVNYSALLVKKDHEKRYHHLMMQSSRFKSEIYFLYKNMNQIEDLVKLSHKLKKQVSGDEVLAKSILELSKGVHEIKKDYIRVVRGLEDIYVENMDLKEISLKDLFAIIEVNTNDYIHSKDLKITCQFKCRIDAMIKDHFYLMSILRNLVNNGIDACHGEGKIYVYAEEDLDIIRIYVNDTGEGISEDDAPYIFNNGFSTKFDEATGNISRGIGLTLVREMVKNIFKGDIKFESKMNKGTTFILELSNSTLKVGADDENIYIR